MVRSWVPLFSLPQKKKKKKKTGQKVVQKLLSTGKRLLAELILILTVLYDPPTKLA